MARTVNVAEHAARRDAILDAAQRLILSNGYERLTVQHLLDDLQISKGAFYHYFDSKPAVVDGLTERLVEDSERALAPIVTDRERGALDKLQRFFGEITRWKSARQNLFAPMLPLWYATWVGFCCARGAQHGEYFSGIAGDDIFAPIHHRSI